MKLDIDVSDEIQKKVFYKQCVKCSGSGQIRDSGYRTKYNYYKKCYEMVYQVEYKKCPSCHGSGKCRNHAAQQSYFKQQEALLKQKYEEEYKQQVLKQKMWEKYAQNYNREITEPLIVKLCSVCFGSGRAKEKKSQKYYNLVTQKQDTYNYEVEVVCEKCQGTGRMQNESGKQSNNQNKGYAGSYSPPIQQAYNQHKKVTLCEICFGSGRVKEKKSEKYYNAVKQKEDTYNFEVEVICQKCRGTGRMQNGLPEIPSLNTVLNQRKPNNALQCPPMQPTYTAPTQPTYIPPPIQVKHKTQAQLKQQFQANYKQQKQRQKRQQQEQKRKQQRQKAARLYKYEQERKKEEAEKRKKQEEEEEKTRQFYATPAGKAFKESMEKHREKVIREIQCQESVKKVLKAMFCCCGDPNLWKICAWIFLITMLILYFVNNH